MGASASSRELPTAINGGGGQGAADDGTRVAGLSLVVGGLLGIGLLSWGVARRRRAQ